MKKVLSIFAIAVFPFASQTEIYLVSDKFMINLNL